MRTRALSGTILRAALLTCFCVGLLATRPRTALPAHDYVPADKNLSPQWLASLRGAGERKVYRGAELETIGMPCGGIGAGQLYVRGDGTLAQWWIDNTPYDTGYGRPGTCNTPMGSYPCGYPTQPHRPPSPVEQGFAVCVKSADGHTVLHRLSRDDFDAIGFIGEYPIATILYDSKTAATLPVDVRAEVFSPFIPLNTRDSATPATIVRYTVRNTSDQPADVALGGWLQNFVWLGREGTPGAQRRNRVIRDDGLVAVSMDLTASADQPLPARQPQLGDITLAVLDGQAIASADFTSRDAFLASLVAGTPPTVPEKQTPLKEQLCGSLVSRFRLDPGQSETVDFLVTWFFPHRVLVVPNPYPESNTEVGNMYGNWYRSAWEVAQYLQQNFDRLNRDTHLFRDTYYDTTLPYWFAQRLTMPVSTLATETVQWWHNGRFWGWEGVGSCLGTCGHVYNPAQAHARLFPELARSIRLLQDLGPAFAQETGRIGFRGVKGTSTAVTTGNWGYAADAQCGYVLKLYREHLLSPDRGFLDRVWPQTKLALEYLIEHDGNGDGVIEDQQHTTWDTNLYGANSYVATFYLAALRAGEEMARLEGEEALAERYRALYQSGQRFVLEKLWNGEYFIQLPPTRVEDPTTTIEYGNGCLSHQLAGQTWAHQVDLGYLYPPDRIATTLKSIYRYNWTPDVAYNPAYPHVGPRHKEYPQIRLFALAGEAGLFECTWPKSDPPAIPVLHNTEVFTGTEYSVAALMLNEGLIQEGLALVRGIHDRYDGTKRNPWNEIECGDHYARAMASWNCLISVSGYIYDGPAGRIGFAPRMMPEDFKCFFTAAEGWGSLVQRRDSAGQTSILDVKWGRVRVKQIVVEVLRDVQMVDVTVHCAGRAVPSKVTSTGPRITLDLHADQVIGQHETLEVNVTFRQATESVQKP